MSAFPYAHATGADWREVVEACLAGLGTPPEDASLGFLYVTDALGDDYQAMVDRLRQATGVAHWVGTVGVGIAATGREYYDAPAAAVMLGSFPPERFRMITTVEPNAVRLGEGDSDWYAEPGRRVALLHGDPRAARITELVDRFPLLVAGGSATGGITSSTSEHHYQLADEVEEGRLSGVLFAPEVGIVSGLTQGCTPIGPVHEVTEAQNNILARIDDCPALEVFKSDIGELLARDLARTAGYIFAGLPVDGDEDQDPDYLVRNIIGADPKRGLVAIGDYVEPGGRVMFCRRDANTARADMLRMLADVKARLPHPPRGGVYVSCLGRGRELFGDDSGELRLIAEELGEFPLVGFFANGEISGNRMYGFTGVLTLFL